MRESGPGAPGEITYRNCTKADIPFVLDLWTVSQSVAGSTDSESALLTRLERDPELFLLACDGDLLVGSLIGGWDGWRANLYRLVVRPGYRRRGIATRLVRTVEQRLKDRGAVRVYALTLAPELEPLATKFWSRAGYERNPRVLPYVKTIL